MGNLCGKQKNVDDGFESKKKPVVGKSVIFILGGPGSGKGTQCAKIVEDFGYKHIAVGDLMRNEIKSDTDQGKQIKKIVAAGDLVPDELTVQLLSNYLKNEDSTKFLVDGFPRTVPQTKLFEKTGFNIGLVIYYDVPKETMIQRLLKRAKKSGRIDDTEEIIGKRV